MELKLERRWQGANSTLGTLKVNGAAAGYVLEDRDRELTSAMSSSAIAAEKVYGKTAIPTGRYEVIVTYSNRFKRRMPLLVDVPGFAGIRIHPGNTHENTEGCLVPGKTYVYENGDYKVFSSRQATDPLEAQINDALKRNEKVFITIERHYQ